MSRAGILYTLGSYLLINKKEEELSYTHKDLFNRKSIFRAKGWAIIPRSVLVMLSLLSGAAVCCLPLVRGDTGPSPAEHAPNHNLEGRILINSKDDISVTIDEFSRGYPLHST